MPSPYKLSRFLHLLFLRCYLLFLVFIVLDSYFHNERETHLVQIAAICMFKTNYLLVFFGSFRPIHLKKKHISVPLLNCSYNILCCYACRLTITVILLAFSAVLLRVVQTTTQKKVLVLFVTLSKSPLPTSENNTR